MENFKLAMNGLSIEFILISDKKEYRKLIRKLRQEYGVVNVIRTKNEDDMEFYEETAKKILKEKGISVSDYNYVIECFNK